MEFNECCPDCGVSPGNTHDKGCDVEICSVCGGQRLSCGCKGHDKAFARWTGFWPGKLEADALGIDLNSLYIEGIYKALYQAAWQFLFVMMPFQFEGITYFCQFHT